jgi:hypothetical protein
VLSIHHCCDLRTSRPLYSDAVRNCHSACATLIQEAGGGMGTVGSDSHWRVDPKSIKYLDEIAQGFQVWFRVCVVLKRSVVHVSCTDNYVGSTTRGPYGGLNGGA